MVTLNKHELGWRQAFVNEAANIRSRLGNRALRVDHVGSTSIRGLAAKPVIDIQVSLASLEPRPSLLEELAALGYKHVNLGRFDSIYPFFAKPGVWPCTHHVHLCVVGSQQERDHLAFRDYLRLNSLAAAEYEQLKLELAAQHEGTTLESQERYSLSKSAFIMSVLASASLQGLPSLASSDG